MSENKSVRKLFERFCSKHLDGFFVESISAALNFFWISFDQFWNDFGLISWWFEKVHVFFEQFSFILNDFDSILRVFEQFWLNFMEIWIIFDCSVFVKTRNWSESVQPRLKMFQPNFHSHKRAVCRHRLWNFCISAKS